MTGLFLSFEGGDGVGKTTQAAMLAERLRAAGREVVAVREPGGTPLGEQVRPWVKGAALAPETELLLFAAARAQLVTAVIRPNLEQGRIVIADRYADSTVAYQGYGRRLPLKLVAAVNRAATQGLKPRITLLLDLKAEEGLRRVGAGHSEPELAGSTQLSLSHTPSFRQRAEEAGQSRFEQAGVAFHRRVRSGFLRLAKEEPRRILVVDAARPSEQIAEAIWQRVQPLLVRPRKPRRRLTAEPGLAQRPLWPEGDR